MDQAKTLNSLIVRMHLIEFLMYFQLSYDFIGVYMCVCVI